MGGAHPTWLAERIRDAVDAHLRRLEAALRARLEAAARDAAQCHTLPDDYGAGYCAGLRDAVRVMEERGSP